MKEFYDNDNRNENENAANNAANENETTANDNMQNTDNAEHTVPQPIPRPTTAR